MPSLQWTPYALPALLAAVCGVAGGLAVWRRGRAPTAWFFCVLSFGGALFSFSYSLEISSVDLAAKLAWYRLEQVGLMAAVAAMPCATLAHVGASRWLNWRTVLLAAATPLAIILVVYTNDLHGWHLRDVALQPDGPFPTFTATRGPLATVTGIYNNLVLLGCAGLLLDAASRRRSLYRMQALMLLAGLLVLAATNWLAAVGIRPLGPFNHVPLALTFNACLWVWALTRYRLFDLMPIAHGVVIEAMPDGVLILDHVRRIVEVNPAARAILGLPSTFRPGEPLTTLGRPEVAGAIETSLALGAPTSVPQSIGDGVHRIELRTWPIPVHDQLQGSVVLLRDVTEQHRATEQLRQEALHDPLTNLENRRSFEAALRRELHGAADTGSALTLAVVDLDRFKEINDSLGHQAGDDVLREVARRIRRTLRAGDLAGRLGGDEFTLLLLNTHLDGAVSVAERLHQAMLQPIAVSATTTVAVSLSVGLAVYPQHGHDATSLMQHADQALYHAKRSETSVHVYGDAVEPAALPLPANILPFERAGEPEARRRFDEPAAGSAASYPKSPLT